MSMSSVGARHGRSARPGRVAGRAVLLALAVLALVAAVITMHFLGAGHQPMAMSGSPHAVADNSQPAPDADTTVSRCPACVTVLTAASDAGQDTGTMCLAVLPLMLLLLVRSLRRRSGVFAASTLSVRLSSRVLTARGPPGLHLCPSLSKLCILRT